MKARQGKYASTVLIAYFFSFSSFNALCKTTNHFSRWHEKITVFPKDNYFSSEVICRGNSPAASSKIFIPYSETEKVENIHVDYFDLFQKSFLHDSVEIFNNAISGEAFYQNLRIYHFEIPVTTSFTYSYSKTSQEVFLFSALDLNPKGSSDTVEYEIFIPLDYVLLYKACNIDSAIQLAIDSAVEGKFKRYHFISINQNKEKSDEAKRLSQYPCFLQVFPAIKVVVVHKSEKSAPEEALNKWCMNLYKGIPGLSKNTIAGIKAEIGNLNDTDALIKNVFRFVQEKIKYIDIENGMNAFRPRDPNQVYKNRQGDCKDMSFLLYSILKSYGINAYIALSASISHPFDMDFPSLASANHNICTVNRNDTWIFLDATENECEYGIPSIQIQGKHVFIVGESMAQYVKVEPVPANKNTSTFNIAFNVGTKLTDGKFNYRFMHSAGSLYKSIYADLKKTDLEMAVKAGFKDLADGGTHELISAERTDSSISFTGILSLTNDVLNSFSGQTYFSIDFMPYLDLLPKIFKVTDPLICYSTLNKNSTAEFSFEVPVQLKNSRTKIFEENGFAFELTITQPDAKKITAHASLIYNDVTITGNSLESYRKMILFATTELTKGIIYE